MIYSIKSVPYPVVIILLLLSCVCCTRSPDQGWTIQSETLDGVPTVRIGGFNRNALPVPWQIDTLLTIGSATGEDAYLLNRPGWVVVDSAGCIYVGDWGNYRIQKYASDGNWLLSFSRQGSGPGEYRAPHPLAVFQDTLYVSDGPIRLIKYILPEGKHHETIGYRTMLYGNSILPSPDGGFFVTPLPALVRQDGIFGHVTAEGDVTTFFGTWESWDSHGGSEQLQRSMNSGSLHRLSDGRIVFVYSRQPRMIICNNEGNILKDVRLNLSWFGRQGGARINPWMSEQFGGWVATSLVRMITVGESGLVVSSSTESMDIIAILSEDGQPKQVFAFPNEGREGFEDRLEGAAELGGKLWAVVWGDPAIREVIIK